ncbi:putative lipoprotein [Cystobacter fuscus DSM 2262]|uniref:Lipoprotein n=1 Tax=Cystobacter fuscus (strain ATCC 25194 / DSM 2262 / NBRC 100088 / M29) TaxID=1242864 RepID=S9PDL1_CYSF2|nr:Ig-like domain-containing protein [Cystobacter fuscus]EPX61111.1 putative lipoprotein [Cystobacter fuscus DSM 2262]
MSARSLLLLSSLVLGGCRSAPATLSLAMPESRPLHKQGESVVLEAIALDATGKPVEDADLRWVSSAPEVASVVDGVVVARKSGRATIAAAAGKVRASVEVQVSIPSQLDIRVAGADFLLAGNSIAISAVVKNELGKPLVDVPPQWESSDETVARVENGRLIGVSPGHATITVTVPPLSRRLPVQVVRSDFARMEVEPTHVIFAKPGQTQQMRARTFNNRSIALSDVPVTWYSSDWSVATVSSTGQVTAVGPGRTVVTATAGRRKAAAEVVFEVKTASR